MLQCGSICRFSVPVRLTQSDAWLSIYARLFCGARASSCQGGTCVMAQGSGGAQLARGTFGVEVDN